MELLTAESREKQEATEIKEKDENYKVEPMTKEEV